MRTQFFWEKIFGVPEKREEKEKQETPRVNNLSLDEELENAWEHVQEKLYCYELTFPEIKEGARTNTACIDMSNHKITINKSFVNYLASKGMDYQTIFRSILSHEAGHFKIMPWDLKNLVMMLYTAEKVCGDKKDVVSNYFMDVSLNLDLMLNKHNDDIHQLYKHLDKNSKIDNLLIHLYSLKTGWNFNSPKLPHELKKDHLPKLGEIKFKQKNKAYENLIRFIQVIKDLIDEEEKKQWPGGNGKGNGKYSLSGIDRFGIGAYDKNEIRRALRELAEELESPADFAGVYKFVKNAEKKPDENKDNGKDKKGLGIGSGTKEITSQEPELNLEALIEFYTAKSEAYHIHVKEKHTPKSGDKLIKSELKSWEAEDPYLDIDVFNSYGKFFPGITKSWNYTSAEQGKQKSKSTPELLLMIDSSGSMTDPAEENSNAVLGAICAARQYLKKNSKVAVVNFSDETRAYGFNDDYKRVAERIIQYQCGGTTLADDAIGQLVSKTKKEVDIMLITDGGIWNLKSVMHKLNEKKNTNRITILNITGWYGSSDLYGLKSGGGKNKISVYNIKKEKDIPKIVVGNMIKAGVI